MLQPLGELIKRSVEALGLKHLVPGGEQLDRRYPPIRREHDLDLFHPLRPYPFAVSSKAVLRRDHKKLVRRRTFEGPTDCSSAFGHTVSLRPFAQPCRLSPVKRRSTFRSRWKSPRMGRPSASG